eukprot:COSAG01_NODE_4445_length_5016_cov_92.960545_2_plen_130_part_00
MSSPPGQLSWGLLLLLLLVGALDPAERAARARCVWPPRMQAPAAVQLLAELYGALVRRHHRHRHLIIMIEAPCSPFASACERRGDPPRPNEMIGCGGAGAGAPTLPHLARRAQVARTDRLRDEGGPAGH